MPLLAGVSSGGSGVVVLDEPLVAGLAGRCEAIMVGHLDAAVVGRSGEALGGPLEDGVA